MGAGLIVWVVSGLIAFLGTLDYLELVCKINILTQNVDVLRWTLRLEGDIARCLKPPVDSKTKVPFWPGLP